ncbi:hypothetical protein F5Y02DRAFT_419698 [Annulohypoxylon stygium]|nr:hypothetical protein F5Y02DRAFT_419698 [Annulohypoxylon stygium]
MFFSKLYLAIFLAGAIAAPTPNDELQSKRDTDNAEYSVLLYSIGKRDSDSADEDTLMYWRDKRAAYKSKLTYFPDEKREDEEATYPITELRLERGDE